MRVRRSPFLRKLSKESNLAFSIRLCIAFVNPLRPMTEGGLRKNSDYGCSGKGKGTVILAFLPAVGLRFCYSPFLFRLITRFAIDGMTDQADEFIQADRDLLLIAIDTVSDRSVLALVFADDEGEWNFLDLRLPQAISKLFVIAI